MIYIFLCITIIISLLGFYNREVFHKLLFSPYYIKHHNEWYRFFSYGFLHAGWAHLFINMLVLYSFGTAVETYFKILFLQKGIFYFALLYIGGVLFSVLFDFGRNKDNLYYSAVGASGAVSAVVFSSILFDPLNKIYLFFIPIGIPAAIFGILYLIYSAYMSKRSRDNIGHNAHFWGAIFGIIYTIILKPSIFMYFINSLKDLF